MLRQTRPVALAAIGLVANACGSDTPTQPAPVAATTPAPNSTPTPAPTPTPTPEPTEAPRRSFPGPVDHVSIKVHAIRSADGVNFRQPTEENGAWIVHVGETFIMDATPKNAEARPCDSEGPPDWGYDETTGATRRVRSPNPFLLFLQATSRGSVYLWATVDGRGSNYVDVEIR